MTPEGRREVAAEAPAPARVAAPMSAYMAVGLAAAGIVISGYLTFVHYSGGIPICNQVAIVDCASVTTSSYSLVPGTEIPVTVPAIIWFAAVLASSLVWLSTARAGVAEPGWLAAATAAWALLGMTTVLYLVYAELVVLHRVCEWCTAVHLLVFLLLLISVRRLQAHPAFYRD